MFLRILPERGSEYALPFRLLNNKFDLVEIDEVILAREVPKDHMM